MTEDGLNSKHMQLRVCVCAHLYAYSYTWLCVPIYLSIYTKILIIIRKTVDQTEDKPLDQAGDVGTLARRLSLA